MAILLRRLLAVAAVALGLVGLAACGAGTYAVWVAEARLQRANDRAFELIDRGLGAVHDRVRRTQQRVEQSRITTSEITQALRQWATREAKDRLVTQLEIETRAEKAAGQLRAADLWLEDSGDTVRDIQEALELGRSLGAEVDPASLNQVLDTLASVRAQVQEAEEEVAEVRGFAATVTGVSDENRTVRVLKLLARVLVTLTEVAPRLDRLADRVSDARAGAQEVKAKTSRYIWWTAIGCTVILAWIAAGQLALCVWGRNRWRGIIRTAAAAG